MSMDNLLEVKALTLLGGLSKEKLKSGSLKEISSEYKDLVNPEMISSIERVDKLKLSDIAGSGFMKKLKLKDRKLDLSHYKIPQHDKASVTVITLEIRMPCNSKVRSSKAKKVRIVTKEQRVITTESKSSIEKRISDKKKDSQELSKAA